MLGLRSLRRRRAESLRVGIALGCLLITTVLVYVEREGYRDSNGTPISWLDALYYATVTLSTAR